MARTRPAPHPPRHERSTRPPGSIPGRRASLQSNLCALLLCALGVALASCASPPPEASPRATSEPHGYASPEALLEALEVQWGARATPVIVGQFAPSRRALIRANLGLLEARLRAFEVSGWAIDGRCHGRSPDLRVVRLELVPRGEVTRMRQGAPPVEEVVWIVFEEQRWWLYSL